MLKAISMTVLFLSELSFAQGSDTELTTHLYAKPPRKEYLTRYLSSWAWRWLFWFLKELSHKLRMYQSLLLVKVVHSTILTRRALWLCAEVLSTTVGSIRNFSVAIV